MYLSTNAAPILRQCCAEARLAASRNGTAVSAFVGVVLTIAKCYSAAPEFVRAYTNRNARNAAPVDD